MEGKTLTNEKRFYPLLVSSSGSDVQTEAESEQVWEQLDHIPVNNKKILLSVSIIENLYNAEKKFNWEPFYSARMSYFVRELFFQNISQSEFYRAIEALFEKQYKERLNEILAYINNVILTSQPDPEPVEEESEGIATEEETIKQYTLLDALSKYSNLAHQAITTERIKLKNSVEPVRPTISNWLKNYRDELGIGRHDAVARAKFLFESLNTKKLPSAERERIHSLVRSLEDNELLTIDTTKQEIVFPTVQKEQEILNSPSAMPTEKIPSPDTFERFQNVVNQSTFPEELQNVGTKTFAGGQVSPESKGVEEQALLSRIKNMMVSQPKANAPAPKEEFQESTTIPSEEVPGHLGTLRFSAKHVLPAERQSFPETKVIPNPTMPLPAKAQSVNQNVVSTPSFSQPEPARVSEKPNKSVSSFQSTPPPAKRGEKNSLPQEPLNIFRIKPSRE